VTVEAARIARAGTIVIAIAITGTGTGTGRLVVN